MLWLFFPCKLMKSDKNIGCWVCNWCGWRCRCEGKCSRAKDVCRDDLDLDLCRSPGTVWTDCCNYSDSMKKWRLRISNPYNLIQDYLPYYSLSLTLSIIYSTLLYHLLHITYLYRLRGFGVLG